MTEKENAELLAYINETPELQSLLYDMDLLPEQWMEGSLERQRMFTLARVWKSEFGTK